MHIWLLQTGEPAPGPATRPLRTAMMASALAARGHRVTWWSSAFDHYAKARVANSRDVRSLAPRVEMRFLPASPYRRNVSLRRYVSHVATARSFSRLARAEPPPDLVVASFPEHHLAAAGVVYAKARRLPVVVDVRDPWPDAFLDVVPSVVRPAAHAALSRDRAKARRLLRDADAVTSMMDSLLEWALAKARRRRTAWDQVFYIGAEAPHAPAAAPVREDVQRILERVRGSFVLLFVGTFGRFNDPLVLVDAARVLAGTADAELSVHFVLVGNGPEGRRVRAAAADLPNVHLPGWTEGADLAALLSAASVGVIACPPGHEAFPNKAFTYLASGLPVVYSPAGDLRVAAEKHGFGAHFPADDPAELAALVAKLARAPTSVAAMRAAAHRFFAEHGDASRIYGRYADYLEALHERSRRA